MVKLYIDFDGVIKNTIDYMYREMAQLRFSSSKNGKNTFEMDYYLTTLDWAKMLEKTDFINDAIDNINKIVKTGLYDVKILTHVNSYNEAMQKQLYWQEVMPDVPLIVVPKEYDKACFVSASGAILIDDYKENLKVWKEHNGIPIHFDEERGESDYLVISCLDEVIDLTADYAKKLIK